MKNVIVAGLVAVALVGCGKKEEAPVAPAACAEGQVESVNEAGEHVCAAAEAAPAAEAAAVEAPAAEAAVVEAAPVEAAK